MPADAPHEHDRPPAGSRHDELMRLGFPPVRHSYTQRDTILYALGVGAGADGPGTELDILFEERLVALPTMAVVLASPGFWYRDLAKGLNHVRTVHASEAFELHAPLPAEADVEAAPRVTAIYDKGPGRGALIESTRTVRDRRTGQALATVRQTAFCRGDGGLGGPRIAPPAPSPIPQRPPDAVVIMTTSPRAALIYRLSGDYNPLHLNPRTASKAGFPAPILHGLSTYGHIGRAILADEIAAGLTILSMDCRFTGFVLPGDTLSIEMWREELDIGAAGSDRPEPIAAIDSQGTTGRDGGETPTRIYPRRTRKIAFRCFVGERKVIDNGVAILGSF